MKVKLLEFLATRQTEFL